LFAPNKDDTDGKNCVLNYRDNNYYSDGREANITVSTIEIINTVLKITTLHTTYNPHDSTMMKVVIKSLGKHNNILVAPIACNQTMSTQRISQDEI
jgi:hypothetical protein